MDLLTDKYPWYTPYQFAGNMPIEAIDLDGLENMPYTTIKMRDPWYLFSRGVNPAIFKAPFYNIPMAKKMTDHYSWGSGRDFAISKKEMADLNVIKTGLAYGGTRGQQKKYSETILALKDGEQICVNLKILAQAATAGTLANFTIKLVGTVTRT